MKKIDPNVASKIIEKETEAHEFWKRFDTIRDDLDIFKSYINVLDYCLTGIQEITDFDYDEIFQFVGEIKNKLEGTKKNFEELEHDLNESGRLGSHINLDKGIFRKARIIVQEIPTTWRHKKSSEAKKKAA